MQTRHNMHIQIHKVELSSFKREGAVIQATVKASLEDIMLREIRPSRKMNTWGSPQKKHLEESNTRQRAQQRLAGPCRMGHEISAFTW